ncbi:hypothetical protein F973_00831 [Acinetobacter sp. CIP 102129]|nr:hypothetical protein F973_00831 [Acinetobacter sp. CIP 102129]
MKTSKYSDSLIMNILKQAEAGTPIPNLCREHGMSSATFYKWKSKYGGMDLSMMTRLKELGASNSAFCICVISKIISGMRSTAQQGVSIAFIRSLSLI